MIKYNLTNEELRNMTVGEFTIYAKRFGEKQLWIMYLTAHFGSKKFEVFEDFK